MESVHGEGPAAQALAEGKTAVVEFADAQEPFIGRIGHRGEVQRRRHRNDSLRFVQGILVIGLSLWRVVRSAPVRPPGSSKVTTCE